MLKYYENDHVYSFIRFYQDLHEKCQIHSEWIINYEKCMLLRKKTCNHRAGEMDFKVEGPWNTDNYFRSPWLFDKKNF